MLEECWDDTHKSRSVSLSTHVDEVVPSRLLTRRGVFVVFLPSVRSVLAVAQIPVCLLVHDTRICCIKAQSLLLAENQSVLLLSSACRAEHICILTGQIVTEYSEV